MCRTSATRIESGKKKCDIPPRLATVTSGKYNARKESNSQGSLDTSGNIADKRTQRKYKP